MSRRRKIEMFTPEDRARIVKLASLPPDRRPSNPSLAVRFGTTPDYIAKIVSEARLANKKQSSSVKSLDVREVANG